MSEIWRHLATTLNTKQTVEGHDNAFWLLHLWLIFLHCVAIKLEILILIKKYEQEFASKVNTFIVLLIIHQPVTLQVVHVLGFTEMYSHKTEMLNTDLSLPFKNS